MAKISKFAVAIASCFSVVTVGGVIATWSYAGTSSQANNQTVGVALLTKFQYGQLYITNTKITGGSYAAATVAKSADTKMTADMQLNEDVASTMSVEVTFYNNTNVDYYYKETEAISWDNNGIIFTVTDIQEGDVVAPKTYTTLTVEYSYENAASVTDASLHGELNFLFTINKEDIGQVVANTALERFEDIINNQYAPDSYQTLNTEMDKRTNNRDESYIGNVAGANTGDSELLNGFFSDVMELDLDGDGKTEPITIMIKRENVDGDKNTGEGFTKTTNSWLGSRTEEIEGAELSVYITAHDFDSSSTRNIEVYVATYTKLLGTDEWTQILPLTKGTATANNYYGGWGGANSFNTDAWRCTEEGKNNMTLSQVIAAL